MHPDIRVDLPLGLVSVQSQEINSNLQADFHHLPNTEKGGQVTVIGGYELPPETGDDKILGRIFTAVTNVAGIDWLNDSVTLPLPPELDFQVAISPQTSIVDMAQLAYQFYENKLVPDPILLDQLMLGRPHLVLSPQGIEIVELFGEPANGSQQRNQLFELNAAGGNLGRFRPSGHNKDMLTFTATTPLNLEVILPDKSYSTIELGQKTLQIDLPNLSLAALAEEMIGIANKFVKQNVTQTRIRQIFNLTSSFSPLS